MTIQRSWTWFYRICLTRRIHKRARQGLSAEQVLRCAVLKTWQQLSYQKLAFHLADSISLRAFCRLPLGWTPCKSCLQDNISRIRASSWEKINRVLIRWAAGEGLEKGKKIRVDATAVESDIHHPTDSQLLYDSIRTLTALLRKLKEHHPVVYSDHCRRAKRPLHEYSQHARPSPQEAFVPGSAEGGCQDSSLHSSGPAKCLRSGKISPAW